MTAQGPAQNATVVPTADRAAVATKTGAPELRRPIEFRFVLKFAPQLSTPCSRGLVVQPRSGRSLERGIPRLFQAYLHRHSALQ